MATLGFEYTSNLVDLLMSPCGSDPLHRSLVPQQSHHSSAQERHQELVDHCVSYGLNMETLGVLGRAGINSVCLLSLLLPSDVSRLLPTLTSHQKRLMLICISRLDPRPPYQMTVGLKRLLSSPIKTYLGSNFDDQDQKKVMNNDENGEETNAGDMKSALTFLENSRKILECPVCYLPCPPTRIWQVRKPLESFIYLGLVPLALFLDSVKFFSFSAITATLPVIYATPTLGSAHYAAHNLVMCDPLQLSA